VLRNRGRLCIRSDCEEPWRLAKNARDQGARGTVSGQVYAAGDALSGDTEAESVRFLADEERRYAGSLDHSENRALREGQVLRVRGAKSDSLSGVFMCSSGVSFDFYRQGFLVDRSLHCLLRCQGFLAGLRLLVLLVVSQNAYGEIPLYVEGLVTEAETFKLDTSIAYANRDAQNLQVGEPFFIQTGPASFVPVYSGIDQRNTNADSIVGTIGLRYGVTTKAEVYGRTSGLWNESRSESSVMNSKSSSSFGVADLWFGVNYMFVEDDDIPGILGFSEVSIFEKEYGSRSEFKSGAIGLAAYKAIDPVVLSMSVAYRIGASRDVDGKRRRPGSFLVANGAAAFAVNDRISLSAGAQWTNTQPDSIDGVRVGLRRTRTYMLLGVGYGINNKNVINASMKSNVSGRDGADLNLAWSYTF